MSEHDFVRGLLFDSIQIYVYGKYPALVQDEEKWIFSNSEDPPSFCWCCSVLGLRPILLQNAIENYREIYRVVPETKNTIKTMLLKLFDEDVLEG